MAKLIEEGDLVFHRDQIRLLEWESPIWLFRDMKRVWTSKRVNFFVSLGTVFCIHSLCFLSGVIYSVPCPRSPQEKCAIKEKNHSKEGFRYKFIFKEPQCDSNNEPIN